MSEYRCDEAADPAGLYAVWELEANGRIRAYTYTQLDAERIARALAVLDAMGRDQEQIDLPNRRLVLNLPHIPFGPIPSEEG